MKISTRILIGLLLMMIAGLLSSNMILKKQYDAIDKEDVYWTYNKILEQPFKHLHITGGNGTHIFYEPSHKPSVRLLQEWVTYHRGEVKAIVRNDTLFLNFDYKPANLYEKFYLENAAPVRIFSPELLSVNGYNTNFEMQKLKQKTISVNMAGKSRFEVESLYPAIDSVIVNESDSSSVVFEISPDYKKNERKEKLEIYRKGVVTAIEKEPVLNSFDETMSFNSISANLNGHCILDIGHAQVKNLFMKVSDSSAVVISGNALHLAKSE